MSRSKVTIDDVAERAGVAAKTVSRVMNNEPYVRAEVRRRVNEAIAAIGYVPNRAARQLASQKSYTIAMFFGNVKSNYMTDLMMSAATACREVGYHLVCEPIDPEDETNAVLDRALASIRPDGIILLPPFSDRPTILATIEAEQIPIARIAGAEPGPGICITLEEQTISRRLVDHLIDKGHRRIGIIAPRPDQAVAQARLRGYREALEHAGIAFDASLVAPGTFLFESGVDGGTKLLDLAAPPTAIFATNDEMAMGVLLVAQQRGIRVPEQLAVAGFDDSNLGRMTWPPLTTVRQPLTGMAAAAVAFLIDRDYHGPALRHDLILRRSTGD